MRRTTVLPAVAAVIVGLATIGCGDSTGANTIALTEAEVAEVFAEMSEALGGAGIVASRMGSNTGAQGAPAFAAGQASPINGSASCNGGGTIGLSGSVNAGSNSASYTVTENLNSCKTAHFTLGGSIKFTGNFASSETTYSFDTSVKGSMDVSHNTDGRAGSCSLDFSFEGSGDLDTGSSTASASGTICGISANAVVSS